MSSIKKVKFNKQIEYEEQLDNIDEDSTDIKDVDETEINDDTIDINELDEDDIYLTNLTSKFLDNYKHLDNYKNKKIIYELCKILVTQMPEHKLNQTFYLNVLDSTIKDIIKPKLDDFIK